MRPFLLVLSICLAHLGWSQELLQAKLRPAQGKSVRVQEVAGEKATVLVFLSPDCPMCKNYTKALRELHAQFQDSGIVILGIIPGKYHSKKEVQVFWDTYRMEGIPVLYDPKYSFTQKADASVTPEVLVLDEQGALVYRGLIDNWAISLGGNHRREVTEFYLRDALRAVLAGTPVSVATTKPMGCLIHAL